MTLLRQGSSELPTFTGNKVITGSLMVSAGPLTLSAGQLLVPNGSPGAPTVAFANATSMGLWTDTGSLYLSTQGISRVQINTWELRLLNNASVLMVGTSQDVVLGRDAADVLYLRRATNPQSLRVYGTYTSGSVFERLAFITAAGDYQITPEATGATLRGLQVVASGGRLGFYGVTAVARQVLATGGGATVDQVITALQNLGLVSQT